MNNSLSELRRQIDQCDDELIKIVAKRFALTNKVGLYKDNHNINSIDKARENQQFTKIGKLAEDHSINPELAQKLLRNIIDQVVLDHEAIKSQSRIKPITMTTLGIIGIGGFGMLMTDQLKAHCEIRCFDKDPQKSKNSLEETMSSKFVVLAVPLYSMKDTLTQIKPFLKASTTLIDVCSVKQQPVKLFSELIPNHNNVVFTHPLFGPQSAKFGLAGHSIIFCNSNTSSSKKVIHFCEQNLELKTISMSAKAHDQVMATIQALTFFVARCLSEMHLRPSQFQTPSFQKLLDLVTLNNAQSEELFQTVENGNIYAKDIREEFIKISKKVDTELTKS